MELQQPTVSNTVIDQKNLSESRGRHFRQAGYSLCAATFYTIRFLQCLSLTSGDIYFMFPLIMAIFWKLGCVYTDFTKGNSKRGCVGSLDRLKTLLDMALVVAMFAGYLTQNVDHSFRLVYLVTGSSSLLLCSIISAFNLRFVLMNGATSSERENLKDYLLELLLRA